jgi:phosphatidylglycerophosphatase A
MTDEERPRPGMSRWVATLGGLGYLPFVPGTLGSAAGLGAAIAWPWWDAPLLTWIGWAMLFVIGLIAATMVEVRSEVHDPPWVIIDEVAAMWLAALIAKPSSWTETALLFILFRIFDITKPPPLRWLERLPGGWGVMLDDIGAAVYAAVLSMVLKVVLVYRWTEIRWSELLRLW